jgi:hypothetical protein
MSEENFMTRTTLAMTGIVGILLSAPTLTALGKTRATLVLTACVHAGESADTYIMTSIVAGGPDKALVPAGAVFRFDSPKGFKDQVGRLIQITGSADFSEIDKGTLKTTPTDDGGNKTTINSERLTVKAAIDPELVNAGGTPVTISRGKTTVGDVTTGADVKTKTSVDTYAFKVDGVKRMARSCK